MYSYFFVTYVIETDVSNSWKTFVNWLIYGSNCLWSLILAHNEDTKILIDILRAYEINFINM